MNHTNIEYQHIIEDDISIATHSKNISILMLNARRGEKDFLLGLDPKYIDSVKALVLEIISEAETMAEIDASEDDNHVIASEEINKYIN